MQHWSIVKHHLLPSRLHLFDCCLLLLLGQPGRVQLLCCCSCRPPALLPYCCRPRRLTLPCCSSRFHLRLPPPPVMLLLLLRRRWPPVAACLLHWLAGLRLLLLLFDGRLHSYCLTILAKNNLLGSRRSTNGDLLSLASSPGGMQCFLTLLLFLLLRLSGFRLALQLLPLLALLLPGICWAPALLLVCCCSSLPGLLMGLAGMPLRLLKGRTKKADNAHLSCRPAYQYDLLSTQQ